VKAFPSKAVIALAGLFVVIAVGWCVWHWAGSPPTAPAVASGHLESRSPGPAGALTDFPQDPAELLDRLRSSHTVLSPEGVAAALAYIGRPRFAENARDPNAEYFNNTIALLLAQPTLVPELPGALLGVTNDPQQSLILRDYASQHLFQAWSREEAVERKERIEVQLRTCVKDAKSPLQGTALLTVARMFDEPAEQRGPTGKKLISLNGRDVTGPSTGRTVVYHRDEFIDDAMRVTQNVSSSPAARASAFHSLIRLSANQAVIPAREIVSRTEAPSEVLCAAIATVSAFGDPASDTQVLAAIPHKSEGARAAAQIAISRLRGRAGRP
jgi:hypothetical protein